MPEGSRIIDKLDVFIRKYYKNKLLKGLLLAATILLLLYIAIVLLEHFGWFGTAMRTVLFWIFIISTGVISVFYIISPLLKMLRLGKCISYEEAASIIGSHFHEVNDKLLNLLQLQQMKADSDNELLLASIDQKTEALSPIPFLNAIDLKGNLKYVKYVAAPILFIVVALLIAPSFITEPSKRLLNHNTFYEKPAPFSFVVENDSLTAVQQEDFVVRLRIEGEEIPNEVSIQLDGVSYKMHSKDKTHYTYTFKNVQRSQKFNFAAVGIESRYYDLIVSPRPAIVHFKASITYPAYTGLGNEVIVNDGDLTVPKGSRIEWSFQTKDADTLYFVANEKTTPTAPNANGRMSMAIRAMSSFSYGFFVNNKHVSSDTIDYNVSVIEDAYPMISVLQMTDSLSPERLFFKGHIKDDYGFAKLEFIVMKTNASDSSIHQTVSYPIAVTKEVSQEIIYSFDLSTIVMNPGDRISYCFQVWDNDGVNGSKSTKSQLFEVQVPTDEEIDQMIRSGSDQAINQAELSISELQQLQQEINEMMRRLVDKKELNWQDKKMLEDLMKRHEQVKNQIMQMRKQIQENNRLEEKYRQQSEQLIEKQRELDRLFEEVLNDEMKEMMREMERLMNEVDKQKVQEALENMRLSNEDIEKQLDQNIELMKRLELEKRVEQAIQKAEDLAARQEELSRSQDNTQQRLEQQRELSEEFQKLMKEIDQIQQEYRKLENPVDFKLDKQLQQSIERDQQNAENSLSKGKQKDASGSQRSAADKMRQLSEQLAEAQMDAEQSELAEDAELVRMLLKNLVRLSFNQESLISSLSGLHIQDPKYRQIILEQSRLRDDFRNVEDSLRAMAKRQLSVASVINKELSDANSNIEKSLSSLLQMNQTFYGNSVNTAAPKFMQYSMTSLNNLALVLAESLDQMQNQMRQNQQQRQSGSCKRKGNKKSGNCSNPGNSKPSAKSMKQMQQELNKQMQSLKQQLDKQGNNPGSNGRTRIGENNTMSSEFARLAAQQEQIRRMMQEYAREMKEQSGGNSKLARELDEMMRQMEETETDLVNRTITHQTIQRQQQIMTRLLQHEKAEMEREKEERRESTEGRDVYQPSQNDLERYKKLQESNIELFRTTPPYLNNYYKNKVNDYFFKF